MSSVMMSAISYLSPDFLAAASKSCGDSRLPWPVYSFLRTFSAHMRARNVGAVALLDC
jgi:hypothetical protein